MYEFDRTHHMLTTLLTEFAAHRTQAGLDVAQAPTVSQLREAHRQELVPAGETLLLVIAAITRHTFLELVPRQVVQDLGENSSAGIHPSLPVMGDRRGGSVLGHIGPKKFKLGNAEIRSNHFTIKRLAGIQNSSPGQQLVYIGKASKGTTKSGRILRARLAEHVAKISGRQHITLGEMKCRYLTFASKWWVFAAEFALITHYRPAWDESGFGSKVPGVSRPGTHRVSRWDKLYPRG